MENLSLTLPKHTMVELRSIFIPENTPSDSLIELNIMIDDKDINVRELGAYLTFIDKINGRLSDEGIYSYSHKRKKQLKIAEVRKGSIELLLTEQISRLDADRIIIIFLVIKYIPTAIRELSSAYKNYEDARLTRAKRKILEQNLKEDYRLQKVSNKDLKQTVKIIEYFANAYKQYIPSVVRFTKTSIKNISIAAKSKNKD